jgi:hypothetical protein
VFHKGWMCTDRGRGHVHGHFGRNTIYLRSSTAGGEPSAVPSTEHQPSTFTCDKLGDAYVSNVQQHHQQTTSTSTHVPSTIVQEVITTKHVEPKSSS